MATKATPANPRVGAERWTVIDGRRWRATDPAVPKPFETELVHELMDARREVGAGGRAEDEGRVAAARARVHDAKVALGERGEPWWDEPSSEGLRERLACAMRALLQHRAPGSSICPSDAARVACGPDWRDWMELAREVARSLHADEVVVVRGSGKGPLRIARGPRFP